MTIAQMVRKAVALKAGETCAFVLLDAREFYANPQSARAHLSMRAKVDRCMEDDDLFDVEIQRFQGGWEPFPVNGESQDYAVWEYASVADLPKILGFFELLAQEEECVVDGFAQERQEEEGAAAAAEAERTRKAEAA